MKERYGGVFHLGGLAGVPFTGMTGWGAFSHHVPRDGHIVLLFAPHVGITADGTVGKVHRPGQDHATSACGASIGAYKYLLENAHQHEHGSVVERDEQMSFIKDALKGYMPGIADQETQNAKMAKLAMDTYAIVEQEVRKIVDRKWMDPHSKLIVLGGVMINIDGDAPDLFLPIKFAELSPATES